jgi:hypothetical protein
MPNYVKWNMEYKNSYPKAGIQASGGQTLQAGPSSTVRQCVLGKLLEDMLQLETDCRPCYAA